MTEKGNLKKNDRSTRKYCQALMLGLFISIGVCNNVDTFRVTSTFTIKTRQEVCANVCLGEGEMAGGAFQQQHWLKQLWCAKAMTYKQVLDHNQRHQRQHSEKRPTFLSSASSASVSLPTSARSPLTSSVASSTLA